MLELVLCSLFTIVPDYLYRRYVQGKRIGREITLYSVWFELRWGIDGHVRREPDASGPPARVCRTRCGELRLFTRI